MNNFFDLQQSLIWSDRTKFYIFTELLTQLFGVKQIEKDQVYRYSTKMETNENHKLILENWDNICLFGYQNESFKKNKRLVYGIINHIITYLNEKYHFTYLIKFDRVIIIKRSETNSKKVLTLTYYDIKFV